MTRRSLRTQANPGGVCGNFSRRVVAGAWIWEIERHMAEEFVALLSSPEFFLRSPAVLIPRVPPKPTSQVVRLSLPEHASLPLIVKYSTQTGFWPALKHLFRRSRPRRAFRLGGLLQAANIPIARHMAAGERRRLRWLRASCLIMEEVTGARSWYEYDRMFPDGAHRIPVFRAFGHMLAELHNAGFTHSDPVRPNFMVRFVSPRRVEMVLVDLDAIKCCPQVSRSKAVKDLRHALARNPAANRERLYFLAQYCRSRTPRLSARDLGRVLGLQTAPTRARDQVNGGRELAAKAGGGLRWLVRVPKFTPQVEKILESPDAFLEQAQVLKPSRSSALSAQDGLVLKRYNLRKWSNLLKDLFRGSKARRCFHRARHLELAGIPTAQPIAFAEQRFVGIPLRSYFLMKEIPEAVPLQTWAGNKRDAVHRIAALLAKLHREGFTHRDLKGGNILFDGEGQPYLIDLDGLRHVRQVSHERAAADLARLGRDMDGWHGRLSRSDLARFLAAYCRARQLRDWHWWWREIEKRRR